MLRSPGPMFEIGRIKDVAEPSAQLGSYASGMPRFFDGPSIGHLGMGTHWMESICQDLRGINNGNDGLTTHLLAVHKRDTSMLKTYAEGDNAISKEFRTESIEERFSTLVLHDDAEAKQAYSKATADHHFRSSFHPFSKEEDRADNIQSRPRDPAGQAYFHRQRYPQEQKPYLLPGTCQDYEEAECERSNKQRSERYRFDGQHFDTAHSLKQPSGRQHLERSQGDRHSRHKPALMAREESELSSWKRLLLAFEELNSRMAVEQALCVDQMHEGNRVFHDQRMTSIHTAGHGKGTQRSSRHRPESGEPRNGKSVHFSSPIYCTIIGPYWGWDSVSTAITKQ